MATITVKNIPDDLYERLKQAAKANHRSINGEIIACIERGVRGGSLNVEEYLERARELREMTAGYVITEEALNEAKREGRP